ncbi:hypothetical protein DB35_20370 [Streptomyces abyssalis]|uniref:Uncharacterized protein n=2 Tax=Streptomyces abyssalis TaxID=933944 RepID=A0A1E7JUP2_9ACTN|nr:hypothetical protein DB35_20370 [Streptomyces abyssalis]OEU93696.1 hypothetical protein AN215_02685 [Streptomyces abyssalis]
MRGKRGKHRPGGEHPTIDALLSGAEVLAGAYDESDVAAVRERVLAGAADAAATSGRARPADRSCPPDHADDSTAVGPAAVGGASAAPAAGGAGAAAAGTAAPALRYPTECEQAAHDLDLAVSLVVNAPEAASSLTRLVDDQESIAPEGALVFGCLLHLARYREAAQFWWQFAAGGGSRTAAFCLCLHHRRHGEFRDADYWRAQAARLAQRARTSSAPEGRPQRPSARPLLPDGVRHGLLSECHGGGHPSLPHALEAVIHRLPVLEDDEDFGEIPQPAWDLAGHLAAR